jgi:trehalose/maltose hydrolase-like predicted phosphorylase
MGLVKESLNYMGPSARADLDRYRPDTALGVHLAGYAVLWETLVSGYAGFRSSPDEVQFNPELPAGWRFLRFSILWRGRRLAVDVQPTCLTITADGANSTPAPVVVCGTRRDIEPDGTVRWDLHDV